MLRFQEYEVQKMKVIGRVEDEDEQDVPSFPFQEEEE